MGDGPENRKPESQAETSRQADDDLADRLDNLDARLQATKQQHSADVDVEKPRSSSGLALGLRLGTEFVVAVLVGAGIGFTIDSYAGTSPWGMIVLLLLGFCAGVLNAMRVAGLVAESKMHLDAVIDEEDEK